MNELTSKLNTLTAWIMGVAGGVILSLLLLVVNLALNLRKGA
jgi:tetrahydromethanopterin S-methyltransferase subunit F